MSEAMSVNDRDAEKAQAAAAAADLVQSGMTVGLGTGSTACLFVRALARRGLDIRCVSTSLATADLAVSLGLEMLDLDEAPPPDLTVDGADEIGPRLALIKGGGAALLREKLVWEASRRRVVIADRSKLVSRLGAFPLPVEITPFGHLTTARRIAAVLPSDGVPLKASWRRAGQDLLRTDGGNLILDLHLGAIADPEALAATLKAVTGVVEHGLFIGLAERALVAGPGGVETLYP